MSDNALCTQWPYFIWKFKNFHNIVREVKENCTVNNVPFNLILEQKCFNKAESVYFKMYIEGKLQNKQKKTKETVSMTARTYILGKLEQKLSANISDVELFDEMKPFEIWTLERKALVDDYESHRQTNGDLYLVCLFQPKHRDEISCPQILLPKKNSCLTTDFYLWNSLDRLSSDFAALFENSKGDLLLKSENYQQSVYRNIISKRCPKLEEKISYERQMDTRTVHYEIEELDTFTLPIFLRYVYCGRIPDISFRDAVKLFIFGSKYSMPHLMDLCAKTMGHHLTEENVLDLLTLAQKYEHENFKSCTIDYILRKNILKSRPWQTFSANNIKLAIEVYRANVTKS